MHSLEKMDLYRGKKIWCFQNLLPEKNIRQYAFYNEVINVCFRMCRKNS